MVNLFKPTLMLNRQRGVVLIVCLVLLLVVTSLGLVTMRGTGLGMKMVSGFQDRTVAFEAAEQALHYAEKWLLDSNLTVTNSYASTCTGLTCFNPTCNNGLCASYSAPYLDTSPPATCSTNLVRFDYDDVKRWQWNDPGNGEPNLWTTASKAVDVAALKSNLFAPPLYVIEFMCFVDKNGQNCSTATLLNQNSNCSAHFRITALASGIKDTTKVMLQTTYTKLN